MCGHALALIFVLTTYVNAFAQSSLGKTVLEGAYTEAQAARGEAAYEKSCLSCHKADLTGFNGPALAGDAFMDHWRELNLDVLFSAIKQTMPLTARGSLSDSAYLDIVAYVLQRNGLPAGTAELTTDTLPRTLLVGKEGPKPVPSSSQVIVVGCFTPAPNRTFMLTNASEPLRTLDAFEVKPEELETVKSKPIGRLSFRLQNLEDLPSLSLNFDVSEGYRVAVKGILVRQPERERINVTALQPIAPGCSP